MVLTRHGYHRIPACQQQRGVVAIPLGEPGDLGLGLGDRPPVVDRFQSVELVHVTFEQIPEAVEDPGTLVDR